MEFELTVADIIRKQRRKLGLTALQLAEKAGTTQQVVSYLENGNHKPRIANLLKLSIALGVDLQQYAQAKK